MNRHLEADIREFCKVYPDKIAVREQKDGKWGNYLLSELTEEQREAWILRWTQEGKMPIRMK